jgi:transmembrane sensor
VSRAEPKIPLGADAINARAAAWLERSDREDWSESDEAALEAWLTESMAHRTAYWRLEAAWRRTERLAALRSAPAVRAVVDAPRPKRHFLMGLAAALAFVAILGASATWIFLRQANPPERTYATGLGGLETVAFADGTKIDLNTNTAIRTRMTTQERLIWLDGGEAYFQVRHDPAHPLVVMIGDRRVTDLGTQFLVQRGPHGLEVAVLQGRVWLDSPDRQASSQTSLLTPGQVATVAADRMSVTTKTAPQLTDELAWRHGMLVFHRTTLAEAAAQFNRYNQQQLVVGDAKTAKLAIDGTFPARDLAAFTNIVQDILHLHVTKRGNTTVITR